MRQLTVGFSRPKGNFKILSRLIRWAEGTEYSHCYVTWDSDFLERELLYQASELRVNFMGKSLFDKNALTVHKYSISVSDEHYKAIVQAMIDSAGIKYGLLQLVGMSWVIFMRMFNVRVRNPFKSGFVCSEAVYHVMRCLPDNYIDIYMEQNGITKDELTPRDVDKAFSRFILPS